MKHTIEELISYQLRKQIDDAKNGGSYTEEEDITNMLRDQLLAHTIGGKPQIIMPIEYYDRMRNESNYWETKKFELEDDYNWLEKEYNKLKERLRNYEVNEIPMEPVLREFNVGTPQHEYVEACPHCNAVIAYENLGKPYCPDCGGRIEWKNHESR